MTGRRRLFIHCGLHKTGSTKIQRDLARLAGQLEERGLYLPHSFGKHRGAHHGLAYAIRGPRYFRDHADRFNALTQELAARKTGDVCLSSEDFESCLMRPRALSRLMGLAEVSKASPVFVIYLRNQVDYFESLYLQMLRLGCGISATEVLEGVEAAGQFAWRKWVFHFDFDAMVTQLRNLSCEVVLRSYHDLAQDSSIVDFLGVVGQGGIEMPQDAESRVNAARVAGNVTRFVRNRVPDAERDALGVIDEAIDGHRPRLSAHWRGRLAERFRAGNARIAAEWGINLNASLETGEPEVGTPLIDRVFRDETRDWAVAKLSGKSGGITPAAVRAFASDWFPDVAASDEAA